MSQTAITISGTVLGPGAPCIQFRLSDGRVISLENVGPAECPTGAQLRLTGHFVRMSRCMQGPGFQVLHQEDQPETPPSR